MLLILSALFMQSCGSSKPKRAAKKVSKYKFDFVDQQAFTDVLSLAEQKNKLIYVDMSAKWCVPCQLMKRDVYTDKETADFFNANFVNYLVDAEVGEGPDLKVIFGVEEFPTLLFVNSKGRVIHKKVGGTYQRDLIAFAKEAMAK